MYEEERDFDRDDSTQAVNQDTCPSCGEFHGGSSFNIRECQDCGIQGCIDCEFTDDDTELCDSCIDYFESAIEGYEDDN